MNWSVPKYAVKPVKWKKNRSAKRVKGVWAPTCSETAKRLVQRGHNKKNVQMFLESRKLNVS